IRWAPQEPFSWTAPDGLQLDGIVLRPLDGNGSPPGVVFAHGGPYGRWADTFNCSPGNWGQWLALAGYAVFMPNPRGGIGHGHAFAATVAGEVGMADWLDVASGSDAFVTAGFADRERLGIGGWSQGGFMTAWAVSGGVVDPVAARGWDASCSTWTPGTADRYRCGVDGAGPTDWGAMSSESDMPAFEAMLGGSRLGDGIGPHRHAAVSPISYADRVRTPLLILHGGNDERVPPGQATGFFRELRPRGVPLELAIYPREPHNVQEQAHQIDILERVRAWYGRWLGVPRA
ncbi:MAG: alpha/beta hydrolase family protein, partial [Dehalococcoidia bacterium]